MSRAVRDLGRNLSGSSYREGPLNGYGVIESCDLGSQSGECSFHPAVRFEGLEWQLGAESDIASLVGLGGRLQFAVYSSKRLRRWSDLSVQSSRPQQLLTL